MEIQEHLTTGAQIAGHCHPKFTQVLNAFRQNFLTTPEVGASVSTIHQGETVVDLWGGLADPKTNTPWERDTISIVFSCTKAAAALCAHQLVEQGKLSLHTDVTRLWPEFAQNGKAGTTLVNMLAHTAPVPHLREPIEPGGLADWDYMIGRVAAEPAWWEPGTRQGYHGLTFAWTVGNLVRIAANQPLGAYFQQNIAAPLGLDFHIGLPETEEHRVAPMIGSPATEADLNSPFIQAVVGKPGSLSHLFATNTGRADFNTREIHAAEISSANGVTNARNLAKFYAPLAAGGSSMVRPKTIALMARASACTHMDATLLQPMRFGLGFMIGMDNRPTGGSSLLIPEGAFGHVGMGGSVGFADPAAQLSFAYTMNRMGPGILLNPRGQSLIDAAYAALGG